MQEQDEKETGPPPPTPPLGDARAFLFSKVNWPGVDWFTFFFFFFFFYVLMGHQVKAIYIYILYTHSTHRQRNNLFCQCRGAQQREEEGEGVFFSVLYLLSPFKCFRSRCLALEG